MSNPWLFFKDVVKKQCPLTQEAWLLDCVFRNKDCIYGQHYQFAQIKNIGDFQKQLPIIAYEALQPWVERLAKEDHILFSESVVAFEKTGGSHSGGKLIPYSKTGLTDFRHALLQWLGELITTYQIDNGCAYWALSPAMISEKETINGIVVGGGDALYLGDENLNAFMQLSAVPFSVAQIQNLQDWQVVTLYYLIKRDDLRLISIWSPSFLLLLLDAIIEHQQHLLALFYEGGSIAGHELLADKKAAERLEVYLNSRKTQQLWPQLTILSCWADASSAAQARELKKCLPHIKLQPKGLLSTEAIITVPSVQGQNLLCVASNFYEFLDQQGHISLTHELTEQKIYQVIVTTNSGLYRYSTGDQVICLGYQQDQPVLEFVGRKGVVSDHVGEKLTEYFVNRCLAEIEGQAMLTYSRVSGGYLLLLENESTSLRDVVFQVEQKLCHNPQYAYARQLGQLAPLCYQLIPKLSERYLKSYVMAGKRLGDIKLPILLLNDWRKVFTE